MGWRQYDGYDGVFWAKDPMVSHKYKEYDLWHKYPEPIARAIYFEIAQEREAAEQEAAKKTPPSPRSGDEGRDEDAAWAAYENGKWVWKDECLDED
jgi:hypothetical protein